jgi:Asp-tRNA(Asn)/Glu-tRNA(Gln) amidotransferase A subunit family amidase
VPDSLASNRPDAVALIGAIRDGRVNAEQVVAEHLDRLEAGQGILNAATAIFRSKALSEAQNPRPGALSGLPVSVKETFGIAGQTITAGSLRMTPVECREDAEAVRRLREAGAIIVARSNVPEFAMAGETDNPRYGQTRNPIDPERTCGGSSGGEAALVASGGSAAGLGSDILGSIRIPASFCGLVGFKPASGAISKLGSWPQIPGCYTDSWLSAGPIVRTVRDARLMYEVLSGETMVTRVNPDGARLIDPVGFPLAFRHEAIPAAVDVARRHLVAQGMRLESRSLGDVGRWYRDMVRFIGWELLPALESMLVGPDGRRASLARETIARWRGSSDIYDGLYRLIVVGRLTRFRRRRSATAARTRFEESRVRVRHILGNDGILLLPTVGTLAPRHGEMNRLSLKPGVNGLVAPLTLCNYLDLPAVTVPAWRCRDPQTGLVPGVMLASCPGAESLLLDVAERLESIVCRRIPGEDLQ